MMRLRKFAVCLSSNELGLCLAILLVLPTIYEVAHLLGYSKAQISPHHSDGWKHFQRTAFLWGLWALVPPFFFLMQWFTFDLRRPLHQARDQQMADMKYGHELASKFWAGGVAILSGLLLSKMQ
jgi:hypothetical protein